MVQIVGDLEHTFLYLRPTLQIMFLELKTMEEGENNFFDLETTLRVFAPTIREVKEVFWYYKVPLGNPQVSDIMGDEDTFWAWYDEINEEDFYKIPVAKATTKDKLKYIGKTIEENFNWLSLGKLYGKIKRPSGKDGDAVSYFIINVDMPYEEQERVSCLCDPPPFNKIKEEKRCPRCMGSGQDKT